MNPESAQRSARNSLLASSNSRCHCTMCELVPSVVKTVEVEPAKVEVKALATPAVVAAPAAYTYHHAAPVAYAGYGYAGFPYAATHVIAKREAEADADPAYFYNGYTGYAGYGFGYGYAGYAHAAAYAHAPSDPTNPHLVHTSRVGICTN